MKLMKQIEGNKNKPTLMCLQSCDWKGGGTQQCYQSTTHMYNTVYQTSWTTFKIKLNNTLSNSTWRQIN